MSVALSSVAAIVTSTSAASSATQVPRTLVAVLAHADDEGPIAPLLARYASVGVQVYMVVVSDGSAGAGQQGHVPRPDVLLTSEELATVRAEEARRAAQALGLHPPILLGFPDGKLGDYAGDRGLIYRATERIAEELQRLNPDVVITWGPDGGTGHPDHRIGWGRRVPVVGFDRFRSIGASLVWCVEGEALGHHVEALRHRCRASPNRVPLRRARACRIPGTSPPL